VRKTKAEKIIRVEEKDLLGYGTYGRVYRISPRRVVKIFTSQQYEEFFVNDEIEGSRILPHTLPILRIVKVCLVEEGRHYIGLVKKYLPDVDPDIFEVNAWRAKNNLPAIDAYMWWNIRKDARGRFYSIDSQQEEAIR
jgi:hypothetical protein